jgi:GTP-binding protein
VIVIIDIRRTPSKEDVQLLSWLHQYDMPALVVLTKSDKLSKSKQRQQANKIARELAVPADQLTIFSAKSGQGKEPLWKRIEPFLH